MLAAMRPTKSRSYGRIQKLNTDGVIGVVVDVFYRVRCLWGHRFGFGRCAGWLGYIGDVAIIVVVPNVGWVIHYEHTWMTMSVPGLPLAWLDRDFEYSKPP